MNQKQNFFQADRKIMLMAHRGGGGRWPENTLYAFGQAALLPIDAFEMDIRSTADGILVVIHDETVDRTTDGTGPVNRFKLSELKKLDAGYRWTNDGGKTFPFRGQGLTVPTLKELFGAFPQMRMNIDIKQRSPSIVAPFCQLIREYKRTDKTLAASFERDIIRSFRHICPELPTALAQSEVRSLYSWSRIGLGRFFQSRAEAVQIPEYSSGRLILTPQLLAAAHQQKMQVHIWTVNQEADMRRLIKMGVDGLITDFPELLLQVLQDG